MTFSDEELKFLAAEWYGGFGGKDVPFSLNGASNLPWPDLLPKQTYTMLVKPSDLTPPHAHLEKNMKQAILAYNPALTKEADTMAKFATRASFIRTGRVELGRAATSFFKTLDGLLFEKKHPLISDLRADGANNGPHEVWNHAVFYYRATYKEILPSDPTDPINNHFMEIDLDLVANADVQHPPSSSQPAVAGPNNGLEVDSSSLENRRSRQRLWIAFEAGTGAVRDDARNEWKHSKNKYGDDLYAPMYLGVLRPTGTTPGTAVANHDPVIDLANGNVMVDLDLVAEPNPLLKVRKRYKR
ncbi:Hypothetical protein A7982_07189 [Minicystis rosea]|nr:Hypothetical protein A7982_07189 [Minicystis rosea]